jgi:serine/threonine protein kinase/Tol biopolymer transport system component
VTVATGSRLGPYEILSPLGAGGMGEVYRARDTRLGREVAIKVLPEALTSDRDRLSRFEQEARSASALNHPNIITIYEIGSADSVSYISMELVVGRTLRDLVVEGPLPAKRVLALAAQIADALAKAHEAGIIHRDLKPENLMVTREGLVKILDFGLAKLALPESGEVSAMPTLAKPETHPGIVLGTVGYMSPEQASGKQVDFRSDQFALGSILYELATGKRAFARPTTAEALVAIIREEPEPIGDRSPQSPVALRWVIERCLAKDPEDRYASTRDLARDLAHLRDHVSEASGAAAPSVSPRRRRWLAPALAAGLVLATALAVWSAVRRRPETAAQPVRFSVPIPPGTTYAPSEVSRGVSVSPDGTRLVIEAFSKGRRHLYLRPLDSESAVELEGSIDATAHFWSPDSRFIAFFADGKLKKIPSTGGQAQELCEAPFAIVGTWSPAGVILFTRLDPFGIYRVADTGGEAVRLLAPDPARGELNLLWPQFLPDGRRFLYISGPAPGAGVRKLNVASLDSKVSSSLGRIDSRVEYAAPGYVLHVREGSLFAQPFTERDAKLRGEPRRLASDVHFFYGPAHSVFSSSANGVLAYQTAPRPSRLVWVDRTGRETGRLGEPSVVRGFRISPDGARVAADVENMRVGSSDIWVFEPARGVSTRLHSDPADEILPVWSADGSRLIYRSDRGGPPDIYELTVEVPGSERPLLELPGVQQPEDVSADGRRLAYLQEIATTVWNISLLPLGRDRDRKPKPWLPTRFSQTSPRFSPDGRWIAYESDETGEPEIYVALTEGGAEKRRISPNGGRRPRWRRDGKELYYIAPGNSVMAVAVTPGPRWQAAIPNLLFRADTEIENWDATLDGSRFLISTPAEKFRESPLRVIVNWPALLKGD